MTDHENNLVHAPQGRIVPTEFDGNSVRLFPFTLAAFDTGHYVDSPREFKAAFMAARPPDLSWFAYDVTVHSPVDVSFVAYDMAHSFSGGIGAKKATLSVTVDAAITTAAISRRATLLARECRQAELDAAEEQVVASYAAAILRAVGANSRSPGAVGTQSQSDGVNP